jgi:hypothetical protein
LSKLIKVEFQTAFFRFQQALALKFKPSAKKPMVSDLSYALKFKMPLSYTAGVPCLPQRKYQAMAFRLTIRGNL